MKALIIGITGQDGSHLAEHLLGAGYEVHGTIRRSSSFNTQRLDHLYEDIHIVDRKLHLHYSDLLDPCSIMSLVHKIQPNEVYNLGAQSHVAVSFDQPVYTAQVNAIGTMHVLEAVRSLHADGFDIRMYQASSSEIFGDAPPPQNEMTPICPRSPYAAAKAHAHWMSRVYREAYGLHVSCGILFNHESERRGETFVTRKITRAATRIKLGLQSKLYLGNLKARRDWGWAGDYVRAMHLMMQQNDPGDYVIATGESYSVEDACRLAFSLLDLDWEQFVVIDPRYYRPLEVHHLCGDSTLARTRLGWVPTKSFTDIIRDMVSHDLLLARQELSAGQ